MSDEEFEKLITGTRPRGSGTSRDVYNVASDLDVVVKRHQAGKSGNHVEWYIWNQIKDTCLSDIFGECITISLGHEFLMMEKLEDLTDDDRNNIPEIPFWVNDIKGIESFGKNSRGQIKLRDYALTSIGDLLAQAPRAQRIPRRNRTE